MRQGHLEDFSRRQDSDVLASPNTITIALFDDHALMREALQRTLGLEPDFHIVATGGTADAAVAAACEYLPDVMLLDVSMPGDGIEAAQDIFRLAPHVTCVMLSSHDDEHVVSTALSAGAYAFLPKGMPSCELAQELRRIRWGRSYISPALAGQLLSDRGFGAPWSSATEPGAIAISEREEQILRRLSQGFTEEEIAASVGLSVPAVGAFLTNTLMKLHEQSLLERVQSESGPAGSSDL